MDLHLKRHIETGVRGDRMKHKQMYVRLLSEVKYARYFTKGKWYPVTTCLTNCGYIVDDQGGTYLLDLDLIRSNMVAWEHKEVDIIL